MSLTALSPSARTTGRVRSAAKVPVVRAEGTRTVVVLRGEADPSTRSVLSDVLSGVLVVPACEVVIDLAEAAVIEVVAAAAQPAAPLSSRAASN